MISRIPTVFIMSKAINQFFWLFRAAFQSARPFQKTVQMVIKIINKEVPKSISEDWNNEEKISMRRVYQI